MPKIKPAFRFRLHPNCGRCYFDVLVWNSAHDLRKATKAGKSKCFGMVRSFEVLDIQRNGKTSRKSIVGEIHLCKGALGIGVVSHEMTHAGLAYLKHRGIKLQCDNPNSRWVHGSEEQLAHVVGNLVRLFTLKAYAIGLYNGGATVKTVKH